MNDIAAIVTGGASGLGNATAGMLAAQGARVAILDLNADAGEAAAAALGGIFIRTDVTSDASVADALAAAGEKHGVARVLINCAGIAPAVRTVGKDGAPHALDTFRKAVEINLVGTFNTISKFAARLIAAGIGG